MKQGVVYWKHLPDMTDYYIDGYVGITNNFDRRMREHKRASELNSLLRIHEQMRIYNDEIKTSIIFKGNYNDCLEYEEELRPRWHIGWNMAIGGGRPGSGWKPNPLWLDCEIIHPKHGWETVSITNKLSDLSKKYEITHKCFSEILLGRHHTSKNWELSNKQLMMKIKERNEQIWNHVYIYNKNHIVSLYKTGWLKFHELLNMKSSSGSNIKGVIVGTQISYKGWKLATKEEWLTTKERIEFK